MNEYVPVVSDHSTFIIAAYVLGFAAIGGVNLWLHLQRRRIIGMLAALEK